MVIKTGIFNSVNDDRIYYAEDFASYFASFIGNGVFPNPSNGLQVIAGTGLKPIIKPGRAWIFGYYIVNTEDFTITLDNPDAVLKRIDRVVVRLNYLNRLMELVVKKGVYASSPVAPALTRNVDMYEIGLADIYVGAGQINITQSNITDLRLNNALCGIVHGTVDQVDTTTIFNQYQAWFNEYSTGKALEFQEWQNRVTLELESWISAQEASFTDWKNEQELTFVQWSDGRKDAFDVWFATIRGILDQEAAGNIMNVLNSHIDSAVPHKYLDASDGQTYLYGLQRDAVLDTPSFVYGLTETGPHNVIPLPNYQQVEDIKNVVSNTGGLTVDVEDKRNKTVATKPFNFATGVGDSAWDAFKNEMATKYPEIFAKRQMQYGRKINLRGSIYMSISGHTIVWFDADTMTVLNAIDFELSTEFRVNSQFLWFEDANYIYVRGTNAANTQFRLGVFDKNTFNYVTSIALSGADVPGMVMINPSVTYKTPEIPFLSGNFFLPGDGNSVIVKYRINYGSGGVPASFSYTTLSSTYGPTIFAIFEYNGHIYSFSTNGSYMYMYKYILNTSTDSLQKVSESLIPIQTTGNMAGHARWITKFKVANGTDFVLLAFGNGQQILSIALDTMTVKQIVMNGIYDNPVFDFKNGRTMWTQYAVVGQSGASVVNGSAFEWLFKHTMNPENGLWSNKQYYVPVGVGLYTASSYQRLVTLSDYAFSLNDVLVMKYGSNYDTTFTEFKMIEGIKEV